MRRISKHRILITFYLAISTLLPAQIVFPSATSAQAIEGPVITSVNPKAPRLEGGTEVIIRGRNFSSDSLLALSGSIIRDAVVVSSQEIRFRVPPQNIPGAALLTVQTRGGLAQSELRIVPKPLSELRAGEITTVAGGNFFLGDGKKAVKASLAPAALAVDKMGNLFVADSVSSRIRRIDSKTGLINTVAGTGESGFSGDNGPAIIATFSFSARLAVDGEGNLFIVDPIDHRIRRIDAATGIITTVAGNGEEVFSGDGGLATRAGMSPYDVAVDGEGNLFIADGVNNRRIRRVDAKTGIITTVAGGGGEFSGDGGPATAADLSPTGVVVDGEGNLFINESGLGRVRRVDAKTGVITTVAGGGIEPPVDGIPATSANSIGGIVALDGAGNLIIADQNIIRKVDARTGILSTVAGKQEGGFSGDGGPARNATFFYIGGLAVDTADNLLIADSGNLRIRRIDARTGIINSVAGNGEFSLLKDHRKPIGTRLLPVSVITDNAGNLFIMEPFENRVRRIDARTGIITTFAGNGKTEFSGDNGPATEAGLNLVPFIQDQSYPSGGLATDRLGNLFIADLGNARVRRVDAKTGIITTVAGGGKDFPGDGGPATDASLNVPSALAIDETGNLFIANQFEGRIRRVEAGTGIITTVAGGGSDPAGDGGFASSANLFTPLGIALDRAGNLFIAEAGFKPRIRRVDAITGIITTVAGNGEPGFSGDGGPATSATFSSPTGVAVDGEGNLFIADKFNNRIRRVDATTGIITTVAGNGCESFDDCPYGDGGPATSATLGLPYNIPEGITLDRAGNLYIADTYHGTVRVVKGIATQR